MMVTSGFSQIMNTMVNLFGIIYTTGIMVFSWLSTPLNESGIDYVDMLGELAYYTPFELMFGAGLILVLILCLVKFILPI